MQYVLEATAERLKVPGAHRRVEEATLALRAYMGAHDGEFPAFAQLDAWRTAEDAPEGRRKLRSASGVTKAFGDLGSAPAALLGGPALDYGARRLVACGFSLDEEALLNLLERWCAEQPDGALLLPVLLNWVRKLRASGQEGTRDVPTSWALRGPRLLGSGAQARRLPRPGEHRRYGDRRLAAVH